MAKLSEKQCREKIEKYKSKCLNYDCCTISPKLDLSEDEQHALKAWTKDYNKYCRAYQFHRYAQGVWQTNEYIENANICFDYMEETCHSMRGMTCALRNFGFDTVSSDRQDDALLEYEEIVRYATDGSTGIHYYTDRDFDDMINSLVDALIEYDYARI